MSDDAEFDAFLKGDDALSRQLQAMPAAAPSAALDAAILQRARDLMAQEARPAASNDPGPATAPPRLGRLSWRWRLPAGIAATVLTGVFAHQAFQGNSDLAARYPADVNEPAALILEAQHVPPPPPPADVAMPAPKVATPAAADKLPAAPAAREEARQAVPLAPAAPLLEPAGAVQQAPMAKAAPAAPPAPAAAMEPAPVALDYDSKLSRRAQENESARFAYSSAKKKADTVQTPAAWVASIEALLAAGKQTEALDEWHMFRKAHPYYVVRHATVEKLEAIEQ